MSSKPDPDMAKKDSGVTASISAAAKTEEALLANSSLDLTNVTESDRMRNLSGPILDDDPADDHEAEDDYEDEEDLYVPLPREELERMELGPGGSALNTSVGVGAQVRKKETFYCELCDVELNSRDTMLSHARGERHREERAYCRNLLASGEVDAMLVIRQVPNPEPLRKKVPVRLQAKLRETSEPVVGLEAVAEFIPISNKEMEPYYQCHLCGNIGEANGMFNHVLRAKHQRAFIDAKFPDDPRFIELTVSQLRELAQRFDERELLKTYPKNFVRTYESDLMFPWPQGKAPWTIEQGGDGNVPDNARERYLDIPTETWKTEQRFAIWRRLEADKQAGIRLIRCNLPAPQTLPDPKNDESAAEMAMWMADLAKAIGEFMKGKGLDGPARNVKKEEFGGGGDAAGVSGRPTKAILKYCTKAAEAAALRLAMDFGQK